MPPLSDLLAEWVDDQARCLTQERISLYDERKAYTESLFLEFPLGEVPNDLGLSWLQKLQSELGTGTRSSSSQVNLSPLTKKLKIAEIPIIYDKVFDITAIVLEVFTADIYKNMPNWSFCAIADDSGGSLFAANLAHIPDSVAEFLQKYKLSLEDCFKPGTIIQLRNAKSFPLRGVGAISFTRTSSMQILGQDMYPHLVNFINRDGQNSS